MEALHDTWIKLKNILERRLDLAAIYVKFHEEAEIVNNEMDRLEEAVKRSAGDIPEEQFKKLEEHWESLVPLYQSAKNTGLTFISEASKVRFYSLFSIPSCNEYKEHEGSALYN